MVLCRYFARGYCRFEANCRYDHFYPTGRQSDNSDYERRPRAYNYNSPIRKKPESNPPMTTSNYFAPLDSRNEQQRHRSFEPSEHVGSYQSQNQREILESVFKDVESAERGQQWIFSCYAPLKEGDNCPGFDDISQEELRWQAYISIKDGSLGNYTQLLDQLTSEMTQKQKILKQPSPEVIACLMQLFQRAKVVNPPMILVQSSASFGLFATANSVHQSQQMHYSSTAPPANASLFGGAPLNSGNTTTVPSLFGGGSAPMGNTFGSQASTGPPANFSFRVATQGENVSARGPSVFGGNAVPQPVSVSGQSLFGGNSSNASVNSQQFAGQVAPSSGSNLGSGNNPAAHTQSFTGFSQSGPPSGFFGKPVSEETATSMSTSSVLPPSSVYTPLDQLNQVEKREFLAETFTPGQIPERPPPKELCF